MTFITPGHEAAGLSSLYSGYLGLAPVKANDKHAASNFLAQLQAQGLIDNMTVSFYIDAECGLREYLGIGPKGCSHIKFGSYDRSSIQDGEELKTIRTAHWGTWDLRINKFSIGTLNKPLGTNAA